MKYFDGIAVGDRVWDFINKWGSVITVSNDYFYVKFDNASNIAYNFDGVQKYTNLPQTLFWDEVKFEKPTKKNIKLTESKYIIDVANEVTTSLNYSSSFVETMSFRGFARDGIKTATKAFDEIIKHSRLLALRDKLCESSRGFMPSKTQCYFIIVFDDDKYVPHDMGNIYIEECVKFRSAADAQLVCDVLNNNRFDISVAGECK